MSDGEFPGTVPPSDNEQHVPPPVDNESEPPRQQVDSARPSRPQREREFGVPVPGDILPPERWVQTALKHWPTNGPLDFAAIFGRQAGIVLDLGCGNGRSVLASAVWRPQFDHLGVDVLPLVIRYATRRANQRGLANVRFGVLGGRELLEQQIASQSITEIHCYHPQPWYEPDQIRLRLITPDFLRLVHDRLLPGGSFILQTDHPAYWQYMQTVVPEFFDWTPHPQKWPDAPKGRTRREIIALRAGLPVFRGVGVPRHDRTAAELDQLAKQLPRPLFNADRSLLDLDRLEHESAGSDSAQNRPSGKSGQRKRPLGQSGKRTPRADQPADNRGTPTNPQQRRRKPGAR